jgi:hypothetical protein
VHKLPRWVIITYSWHAIIVILPLHSVALNLFLQSLRLSYKTSGMYNIKCPSLSHCQWNTTSCNIYSQLTNSWTSQFSVKLHQILPRAIMDLFIHFYWSLGHSHSLSPFRYMKDLLYCDLFAFLLHHYFQFWLSCFVPKIIKFSSKFWFRSCDYHRVLR